MPRAWRCKWQNFFLKPLHAAPAADYALANHRVGRRVITEARGALTHKAGALYWWSASGARQVPHQLAIQEAMTDEVGCIIVYADRSQMLHRLDCNAPSVDENLNIRGDAPALSDDGRYIAYSNTDGALAVYDRVSRASVTGLIRGDLQSFTVGGNRFLFASSSAIGLLRMDLWSGEVAELLPLLPSIETVSAAEAGLEISCAFICYGQIEPVWYASPGMVMQLTSSVKDLAGWRMTMAGQTSEAMQIPYSIAARQRAILTHPDYVGLKLMLDFWIQPAFACLATVRDDLQRPVTASDPAFAGESIRIYMTGLSGTQQPTFGQPNPDGVIGIVNPPALADPGASETLFFGLTPGLIGIQQLDLRIARPFTSPTLFASNPTAFGCLSPAVIRLDRLRLCNSLRQSLQLLPIHQCAVHHSNQQLFDRSFTKPVDDALHGLSSHLLPGFRGTIEIGAVVQLMLNQPFFFKPPQDGSNGRIFQWPVETLPDHLGVTGSALPDKVHHLLFQFAKLKRVTFCSVTHRTVTVCDTFIGNAMEIVAVRTLLH